MQGWMLGKPVSPSPTISKAGPPPVKVAARDSVSHSTASSSSPTSSGSLPDTDGVPEEALAYMGIHGRSSPSPLDGETTEYPIPGRTSSPACEATNGKPPRADFGTALLRACHAENRGGTADLLAIMRKSSEWGFAYTDVDLPVKVWYGDRDEKINEKSACPAPFRLFNTIARRRLTSTFPSTRCPMARARAGRLHAHRQEGRGPQPAFEHTRHHRGPRVDRG